MFHVEHPALAVEWTPPAKPVKGPRAKEIQAGGEGAGAQDMREFSVPQEMFHVEHHGT